MIEFALLGLLKERPMHGYDLRKRLREEFGPLSNLSYGSLYPALARLEAEGAIQAVGAAELPRREPVPFTGSLGGERAATVARRATQAAALALSSRNTRGRKVYEITERGESLFEQLLEADAGSEDARGFTLRLAFARHLSPAARLRLLERRRLDVAARLDRAARALVAPSRPLDRYEQAIAEHARQLVASELAWIESLIEVERLGGPAANGETAESTESAPASRRSASRRTNTTAPAAAGARVPIGRNG